MMHLSPWQQDSHPEDSTRRPLICCVCPLPDPPFGELECVGVWCVGDEPSCDHTPTGQKYAIHQLPDSLLCVE